MSIRITAFDIAGGIDREIIFEGTSVQLTQGLLRNDEDQTVAELTPDGWYIYGRFWSDLVIEASL